MARSSSRVKKRRGNVVTVNFKGVEGRILLPEDQYRVKVAEVSQEDGSAAAYLKWKFEVSEGKFEGKPLYHNSSLSEQALWSLRNLLETIGVDIPDDEMDIDLEELVGKELMVTVTHEDYEGRARPRLTDFAPLTEEEEEDDEPKAKKKGSGIKKNGEVPMDDEDDEDEPKSKKKSRRSRDEDEDEDEEEAPKSRKSKRASRDEDEDEDEEEAPKSKKSKGKKKRDVPTAEEIGDMSEDELEEVIEEHGLDIDLKKFKTMTKKQNAVSDALEDLAA